MSLYSNQVLKYFSEELKKRFVKQGYNQKSIDQHFTRKNNRQTSIQKEKHKISTRKAKFLKHLPATRFYQTLPILFENTRIYLIQHFKTYFNKKQLQLFRGTGI